MFRKSGKYRAGRILLLSLLPSILDKSRQTKTNWSKEFDSFPSCTAPPSRIVAMSKSTHHPPHFTVDVFAIFSPVFSLRIFYKKHAKNHTSNKPRAFKICVQLSFDKLIWYTKFHKDWSTRRQKHHWSKFFDGLVKYRTENRKTVHCAV